MSHLLIILLIIFVPLIFFFFYFKKIRQRIIAQILERNILKHHPKNAWYSSEITQKVARRLNKLPKKKLHPILQSLKNKDYSDLLSYLTLDAVDEFSTLYKHKKLSHPNPLQKAEQAFLDLDFAKARKNIESFSPNNKIEKARTDYLLAWFALEEGDLLSASEKVATATKQFQKSGLVYEEALAYLLAGTIYRVSAIFDTADFMFKTATQLFGFVNASAKEAETWASLGMLMVAQQRFEEADDAFEKAKKLFLIAQDKLGETEIINQQALAALIQGQLKKANKLALQTKKEFTSLKNLRGQALSLDILAQVEAAQNLWDRAYKNAKAAEALYLKTKNFSALQEMMFLQAQALLAKDNHLKSEQVLRELLKETAKHKTCFHVANVYNLLGIIYLKQGDFRRAEGLFQQSLSNELQNDRIGAAAIDYANIALAAYRRGHKEIGDKNKEMALQCAKDAGEDNLLALLKQFKF